MRGFQTTLSAHALPAIALGTVIGYVFGLIPGMQSTTALVLLLPFTSGWDPMTGMYILAGVIGAAGRGGSIAARARNMPGTVVNMCTVLDNHPWARGMTGWALGIAARPPLPVLIVLVVVVPVFLPFAMLFEPAELFWIMALGIACMSVARGLGIMFCDGRFGGTTPVARDWQHLVDGSAYLGLGHETCLKPFMLG